MDLLELLLDHDHWATAQLLDASGGLTDAQLDQPFDIGHRTLRATFAHMIGNVFVWSDLIAVRPAEWPQLDTSIRGLLRAHERSYGAFHDLARRIRDEGRLDEVFLDTLDTPPTEKRFGGAIVHVITHDMHHRAHLISMLGKLGVPDVIEGDALSWEMHQAAIGRHGDDDIFE